MSDSEGNESSAYTTGQKVALGGGGVAALGAFLPWIEASAFGVTISKTGIDGDGVVTLALAVIVVGVVFVRSWDRLTQGVAVVAGILVAGLALLYITDPAFGIDTASLGEQVAKNLFNPGIGLYATAVGGVGMLGGGLLGVNE